ncbi:hypothetical protein QU39_00040, partial [Staphylococcus aureus]
SRRPHGLKPLVAHHQGDVAMRLQASSQQGKDPRHLARERHPDSGQPVAVGVESEQEGDRANLTVSAPQFHDEEIVKRP